MAELKKGFEKLAFEEVKTYLNSGNVIFSSGEDDTEKLTKQIQGMIKDQFDLDIPVFVISSSGFVHLIYQNFGISTPRVNAAKVPVQRRTGCEADETLYGEERDFRETILQTAQDGTVTGRYQVRTGYPPE